MLFRRPIVDLTASVADLDAVVDQASERLVSDGWCYVPPELDLRPSRSGFATSFAATAASRRGTRT
jgi:hypothetical protein